MGGPDRDRSRRRRMAKSPAHCRAGPGRQGRRRPCLGRDSFNQFASTLGDAVNALHSGGQTSAGTTCRQLLQPLSHGRRPQPGRRPHRTRRNRRRHHRTRGNWTAPSPTRSRQLGTGASSPDNFWPTSSRASACSHAAPSSTRSLTAAAETSALTGRASSASVSLDEENVSLLTNQHAYQAAARVMTAVDEALDVFINHTGLVGR